MSGGREFQSLGAGEMTEKVLLPRDACSDMQYAVFDL